MDSGVTSSTGIPWLAREGRRVGDRRRTNQIHHPSEDAGVNESVSQEQVLEGGPGAQDHRGEEGGEEQLGQDTAFRSASS